MKLQCETFILNRAHREIKGRFQKSTLAIGKTKDQTNLFVVLITQQNKVGKKYGIISNYCIHNVFIF